MALPLELLDRWATGWGIGGDVGEELGTGLVDQSGAVDSDELEQLGSVSFMVLDGGEHSGDGSWIGQQGRAEATEAAFEPLLGAIVVQGNTSIAGSSTDSAVGFGRVHGELTQSSFCGGYLEILSGGRAQAEHFCLDGWAVDFIIFLC